MNALNKEKALYFISKKIDYPLYPPRNVTLTLNYMCNQRCLMCSIKDMPFDKKYEIKISEIKKVIDDMVALDIPELVLTGGEPFLFEGIFDVIEYAKRKARKVIMITNGFYESGLVEEIIGSGADHLQVSLDGSTAAIYEAIRRVPGSFDTVIGNINKFIARGKSVGVTATIMRQNFLDLKNIALLAKGLGCRRLALRPAHVSNADPLKKNFKDIPFWIQADEIGALRVVVKDLKAFDAETGFLDFAPGLDLIVDYFKEGSLPPMGSCFIGFTRMIISYNEKGSYGIWMCRDMTGDIRKNSLREIWCGKGARKIRRAIRKCGKFCLFPEMYEPDLKNLAALISAMRRDAAISP
jgi:MoaA/NifB/PqqE/SkfB family radical SAM enzyme